MLLNEVLLILIVQFPESESRQDGKCIVDAALFAINSFCEKKMERAKNGQTFQLCKTNLKIIIYQSSSQQKMNEIDKR